MHATHTHTHIHTVTNDAVSNVDIKRLLHIRNSTSTQFPLKTNHFMSKQTGRGVVKNHATQQPQQQTHNKLSIAEVRLPKPRYQG